MRRGRAAILSVAAALGIGAATILPAQTALDTQRERLQNAREDAAAARRRSSQLEAAAKKERDAAARARAEKAAVSARIDAARSDIEAAQARVAITRRRLANQRSRLGERQEPIARLVAALQSLARRPAVLSIAQPGSTRDIVHVRAMLGTMMPVVRARTADLRAEIDRVQALRSQAQLAVKSLSDSRQRLEDERMALAKMEARHRLNARDLNRSAMVESDRAIALGERARDIVDRMDVINAAAATREQLAALPGPLPRPTDDGDDDSPHKQDKAGASPYILPVVGQVETGLGEVSDSGVRSRGLTLAAWPGARVVAPAAGRVLVARKFGNYGDIVLIDHGKGWTTLVTGLGGLSVSRGDRVAQGKPIGRAPQGDEPRVTVELRRKGEPVDLTGLLG
ncbi:murein hydrolase activator EnvC family protein [Stakelama marina]|uniref:Peptidoglycan DD-metalloendopeptidase family protein n=1 Tax=Stakelama marina TaxID=2826939 RepID=A0A8T4IL85_9SPHN|nr:peptidoglycan DD-metalloendopeptidase family protein [Stakelama marina]MBR0552926.1 peptidoglycan DD-metalloendopeptidase family protein [Stakelama marina]